MVKLDQVGCVYVPHVTGLRVKQTLEIANSDETLHTVHAMGQANPPFNLSQAMQKMTNTKTFNAPEVMVPFKCEVHSWMYAYVGVLDHPYFAVTHGGGTFELKGVPAGTYTVEAWHEKLGTQTQSVTLGEKESKEITFTFKAARQLNMEIRRSGRSVMILSRQNVLPYLNLLLNTGQHIHD